jgi:hypothetical protein
VELYFPLAPFLGFGSPPTDISPSELQEMEKLNPKSPHELWEEQEEQQFLNGRPSKQ